MRATSSGGSWNVAGISSVPSSPTPPPSSITPCPVSSAERLLELRDAVRDLEPERQLLAERGRAALRQLAAPRTGASPRAAARPTRRGPCRGTRRPERAAHGARDRLRAGARASSPCRRASAPASSVPESTLCPRGASGAPRPRRPSGRARPRTARRGARRRGASRPRRRSRRTRRGAPPRSVTSSPFTRDARATFRMSSFSHAQRAEAQRPPSPESPANAAGSIGFRGRLRPLRGSALRRGQEQPSRSSRSPCSVRLEPRRRLSRPPRRDRPSPCRRASTAGPSARSVEPHLLSALRLTVRARARCSAIGISRLLRERPARPEVRAREVQQRVEARAPARTAPPRASPPASSARPPPSPAARAPRAAPGVRSIRASAVCVAWPPEPRTTSPIGPATIAPPICFRSGG